ncbi:peroxisomal membrane protein 11B [Parasteatoda tepidariorum]|uniref:peroxisomal membrane protein 11B n=1 Tax=Parasteatoda tepidariorum TaxID=114398 RepID=UPI001C721D3F|nr:peroxisomal membrane protein 11B [Parasteatoda tepidariorum]
MTMDSVIKFNNKSGARDKLFRLAQYSCKLIWSTLENKKLNKELIKKLKDLETVLSTGRKLYRFGRGFETLYSCLGCMHLDDPVLHFTITFSKINTAMYLFVDHFIWLNRVGLINIDKDKWSKLYYKFWLNFVVMNLARDIYEIKKILERQSFSKLSHEFQGNRIQKGNTVSSSLQVLFSFLELHKDVIVDTVKNGCDLFLPLAQMGHVSISSRTMGILGMISSVAGMLPLIDSTYKLSP